MKNLPGYLTPLIGRERELATLGQLLRHPQVRLLTLTGPGGVGKTRLAIQAAGDSRQQFTDGVIFVSLAIVSDPDQVLPTVARTLGLREKGSGSLQVQLIQFLHRKKQLLLLDDFDQVVQSGPMLGDLLTASPHLKLLITSREVLRVRGEQEFAVPLLSLPDLERLKHASASMAKALSNYSSVALFLEQARAHKHGFQPGDEEMLAIAEICVRLDGLPLALELAAARMKLFSPQALLAQLRQTLPGASLRLLTGGSRDLPARQRTLRRAIQWSYDLLGSAEQQLFRHLSVFAGGFTLSEAETFITIISTSLNTSRQYPISVLEGIASLHDKSLVQQDQSGDETRFTMLEMLREFSREQLDQHGETTAVQLAHAVTYLALAETAAQQPEGPEQASRLRQLSQEHDNLRAALSWAIDVGDVDVASRFGVALWPYWVKQGYLSEGLRLLERILALSGSGLANGDLESEVSDRSSTKKRADLLYGLGILAYRQYAWGEIQPRSYLEQSLTLFRFLGSQRETANALTALSRLAIRSGDLAKSAELSEEALAIHRRLNNRKGIATALDSLGRQAMSQGDMATAQAYARECLSINRSLGDQLGEADALHLIGNIAFFQNDLIVARERLDEAKAKYLAMGNHYDIVNVLGLYGMTMIYEGELAAAAEILQDTLPLAQEAGNERALMLCLMGLALIALERSQLTMAWDLFQQVLAIARKHRLVRVLPDMLMAMAGVRLKEGEAFAAVQMLSAASAFRLAYDFLIPPIFAADYNRLLLEAQNQLNESEFEVAWAKGPQTLFDLAPDEFRTSNKDRMKPAPIPPPSRLTNLPEAGELPVKTNLDQLTPRELDVLRLVAQGLTDIQVAEQLVLSPRTVHGHLRSIYSKLGVNSRTAAARQAIENDLL